MCAFYGAYISTRPLIHFHAVFFGGISETTNVVMTFVDIYKHFPELRKTAVHGGWPMALYTPIRAVFAISFIIVRLIMWTPMVWWNVSDAWEALWLLASTRGWGG